MDNITHTLIGVLVGEAAARATPATASSLPADTRRTLFVGLMALGSNLPDLDFIYSSVSGNKLDYLLQHRGHTHTVIGAVLIGAVLYAACTAWLRLRKLEQSHADRAHLFGMAVLASLLHIVMDYTNSYGVHPFWPFHNGWLYGDSVFIVEPLLWAAATPLLVLLRSALAKALVALVLLAGIVLSFVTGLVPTSFAIALTALIGVLALVSRVAAPRTAALTGVAVWIGVTAMFSISSRIAATRLQAMADPPVRLLDHVLTPMPVNPLCWDVIAVRADANRYSLARGMLSLAPSFLPAQDCPNRSVAPTTAPLTPSRQASTTAMQWRGELSVATGELRDLAEHSCQAAAMLRFSRAPFVIGTIIGDLRFDREPAAAFAEVRVDRDRCPAYVPPWTPPRTDLLGEDLRLATH